MITELKWDSNFFRRKIGKLTSIPSEKRLKRVIEKAFKDEYAYLTCRFILKKMSDIQILERHGFYITDIGVMWEKKVDKIIESTALVREAVSKDAPLLKAMARGLFRYSRFYNDPFFIYEEAEKLYQVWIENSLHNKEIKTFLIEGGGFITCKKLSKNIGEIQLIGVVPEKQDRGLGSSLVHKALNWFNKIGVKTVTVRTQANNIKAMNFYKRLGFNVKYTDVTMGLILDQRRIP